MLSTNNILNYFWFIILKQTLAMNTTLIRIPIYFFLLLFAIVACDSGHADVEGPVIENEYLVKSELHKNYSATEINGFISLALLIYQDQKEELEKLRDYINSGVKVYKIIYNTEFGGETIQASGLVCMPDKAGAYPILSYQNGTNTLHESAPTENPDSQLFQILEMMGSTGFIITLPDYLGFGESDQMFHPYLHKTSTVQTITDMLRAVKEMTEADDNIEFNKDLYISGYSQGGWATMCLQKAIETQYSDEFNLRASVCSAGPYSLLTLNEYIIELAEYPMPYFVGYIFNSFLNLGLPTTIDEVFQQPYADRIPGLYDGSNSGSEINGQLTTSVSDLLTADYISGWNTDSKFISVTTMLDENTVRAYNTKTPTLLMHGTSDDYVPPVVTEEIYNAFMNIGVSDDLVRYVPLAGMDHGDGIIPSGLASISWFIELKN